jgi:hypothetical protein
MEFTCTYICHNSHSESIHARLNFLHDRRQHTSKSYVTPLPTLTLIVVSGDLDHLLTNKRLEDQGTHATCFEARSSLAKLTVVKSRLKEIESQVEQLQIFTSSDKMNSNTSLAHLSVSLRSIALVIEEARLVLLREKHACVKAVENSLSIIDWPGEIRGIQIQIRTTWQPGSLIAFTSSGVEYHLEPPCDTKPGDWLSFNPQTRILSKLNT